jgi:hypothetical protein
MRTLFAMIAAFVIAVPLPAGTGAGAKRRS